MATCSTPRPHGTQNKADWPRFFGLIAMLPPSTRLPLQCVGAWRSLVAHWSRGPGVVGSNPIAPTIAASSSKSAEPGQDDNFPRRVPYQLLVAASIASMLVNFSRGLPSRAAAISAASIFCQSRKVTTSTPRPASSASRPGGLACPHRADIRHDLLGDGEAVGPVGADRARRPAPRPADRIEAGQHAPFLIGEAARRDRHRARRDRRGAIADAAHHQPAGIGIGLAGAVARPSASSAVRSTITRSTLPSPSIATGIAKKSKTMRTGLSAPFDGEVAQVRHRFALPGIEQ
jgi:hypothetical protein